MCLLLLATPAFAQQHDAEARAAFIAGREAYEAKHYDQALEQFKLSYTLSGEPALLYNIASALQSLNRPGEAATSLRDYIKARPNDPTRPELEGRITTLDEAQQLIDREHTRVQRILAEEEAARRAAGGWIAESEVEHRLSLEREHDRRKRRRTLILGLSLSLGPLVIGGVVAGIVCGLGKCSSQGPKDYDFGKTTVTP
jgi:predicted Zn-dependent protease